MEVNNYKYGFGIFWFEQIPLNDSEDLEFCHDFADSKNLVGPNTVELTTVSTVDPIKAYFTVNEQEYREFMRERLDPAHTRTESDAAFELLLGDGSEYGERGRLYAADNQMDARTGALRVAVVFPNPHSLLLPGQFARVRLRVLLRDTRVVPQRSVIELQGVCQVVVVDSNHVAHVRAVRMGARNGPLWIVEDGLLPGEQVVVEGVQKARDGTRVTARPFVMSAARR